MLKENGGLKRIKVNFSAILMLGAMIISDRAEMLLLYFFSAFLHECGHLLAARMLGIGVKEIRIGYVGTVIGCHSGPGTLALFFLGSER